jgi:hypothetical protein
LLSEEAFNSQNKDIYNSNLFGEDMSQIVGGIINSGHRSGNEVINKACGLNTNKSAFFEKNKEWLDVEIQDYVDTCQKEISHK